MTQHSTGVKKRMSLNPQTLRIRARVAKWSSEGRKHWDLFRFLLDPFLLLDATRLIVANGGSHGLDHQSIEEVKGKEWEFARSLSEELRSGAYHPSAVRRVYIPKKDGSKRPLGIPSIKDRVIQRALVLLMEGIYEQRFHVFSFGFRPGRRAVDCVAHVARQVYTHRHVLEADIEKFFDRVSHKKLLGMIKQEIVDPRILRMIKAFLRSGFQEVGKPWQGSTVGTPQGGPLSPLLANIYLHYALDARFQEAFKADGRVKLYRYADDFVIVATSDSKLITARRLLYVWMGEAGLVLKESKTREVDMSNHKRSHSSKFDFLGFKIHLRSYKDNPQRLWIARQPSESSRRALRARLRERSHAHLSISLVKSNLHSTWRGWSEHFRYSNSNRIFYRELGSVHDIIWRYLRRKFRRQRCPVTWERLLILHREIAEGLRPLSVIPDHFSHQRQVSLEFGRAGCGKSARPVR